MSNPAAPWASALPVPEPYSQVETGYLHSLPKPLGSAERMEPQGEVHHALPDGGVTLLELARRAHIVFKKREPREKTATPGVRRPSRCRSRRRTARDLPT